MKQLGIPTLTTGARQAGLGPLELANPNMSSVSVGSQRVASRYTPWQLGTISKHSVHRSYLHVQHRNSLVPMGITLQQLRQEELSFGISSVVFRKDWLEQIWHVHLE